MLSISQWLCHTIARNKMIEHILEDIFGILRRPDPPPYEIEETTAFGPDRFFQRVMVVNWYALCSYQGSHSSTMTNSAPEYCVGERSAR